MAYTSSSAEDRLAAVRAAIERCLVSQQYSVRGRTQMMAQLATLERMEQRLMQEVAESGNGGRMASVGRVVPPR